VSFFSNLARIKNRSAKDLSTPEMLRMGEAVRADAFKRRQDAFARVGDGFTHDDKGRCGYIYFRERDKMLEIYWEMSGVPAYDIIIDGIPQVWTFPEGLPISVEKRLELLSLLRIFLADLKVRTDLELPGDLSEADEPCMWHGCERKRLRSHMYCLQHFEMTFISQNEPNQSSEPTLSSVTPPAGQESRPR
jgi:hypothetical protein